METMLNKRPRVASEATARALSAAGVDAREARREFGVTLPVIGAADNPTYFPLSGPTISGTTWTVDFLLNNPTQVTAIVNDLTLTNFFLDEVFAMPNAGVEGGGVLYEQVTQNYTYADRDVERIEPGREAPIITGARPAKLFAPVEKFGGKFPTTYEARRRNDIGAFNRMLQQLANTIVRKMHQRGMAELAAAISAYSRTAAGVSWADAIGLVVADQAPNLTAAYDLAKARAENEKNELGYTYDTLIVNPDEMVNLDTYFSGREGRAALSAVLAAYGIQNVISTPRKTAGTAYLLASGQVGEMRLEEPLRTNMADEKSSAPTMIEQTWTQSLVNPVFYVTDPYAVLELTGLNA